MTLSRESSDWHLTPRGWVEGAYDTGFRDTTGGSAPSDSVGYIRLRSSQSSMHSKEERWTQGPVVTGAQETWDRLYAQFGPCPEAKNWDFR